MNEHVPNLQNTAFTLKLLLTTKLLCAIVSLREENSCLTTRSSSQCHPHNHHFHHQLNPKVETSKLAEQVKAARLLICAAAVIAQGQKKLGVKSWSLSVPFLRCEVNKKILLCVPNICPSCYARVFGLGCWGGRVMRVHSLTSKRIRHRFQSIIFPPSQLCRLHEGQAGWFVCEKRAS